MDRVLGPVVIFYMLCQVLCALFFLAGPRISMTIKKAMFVLGTRTAMCFSLVRLGFLDRDRGCGLRVNSIAR